MKLQQLLARYEHARFQLQHTVDCHEWWIASREYVAALTALGNYQGEGRRA